MNERERLRRMVDSIDDYIIKAHYFKTIGDIGSARKWAFKVFTQKISTGSFKEDKQLYKENR